MNYEKNYIFTWGIWDSNSLRDPQHATWIGNWTWTIKILQFPGYSCVFTLYRIAIRVPTKKKKKKKTGAPNANFRKIPLRKTIWDLEFSEHFL